MQHVAAADRVAGDHRDHGLGQAADLDLQVEHVEAAGALGVDVAVVAANALVAARAEGLGAGAGEDDHADLGSSRATSNALDISNTVVGRKALRTSGRLIVILAMPSQVS